MCAWPDLFRAIAAASLLMPCTMTGQAGPLGNSPAINRFLNAQPAPVVLFNPDRTRLLILEPEVRPAGSEAGQPEALLVAGLRFNPRNTAPVHLATYTAVVARPIGRGETRRIIIPWKARVANPAWSPDGDKIAFTVVEDAGMSLWVAEAWNGESRMLAGPVLNGVFGNPCRWLPSGSGLLCAKVVSTHDGSGLERYLTSQLTVIPLSGSERLIGAPGVHSNLDMSPDGRYFLVESPHAPWSTEVPWRRFPLRTEIRELSGAVVKVIADRGPLPVEPTLGDGVPAGPRAVEWRGDAPATVVWVEAQDGGDPGTAAAIRDRVVQLAAPFTGAPVTLIDLAGRSRGNIWAQADLAVVNEGWAGTGRLRTWIIDPGVPGGAPKLLNERAAGDRYADPGQFLISQNSRGRPVLHLSKEGGFGYLAGVGASPLGDRPFLDRVELSTRKLVRLWRSEAAVHEEAVAFLSRDEDKLITLREGVNQPPNYFIRDLRKASTARLSPLTEFKDPAPDFSGVTRQLIALKRRDGVSVPATLYLPAGYRPAQGRLPFVIWVTPEEFRSVRAASQMVGSPSRFTRPTGVSPLFFLLSGYGVLELPAVPIIGGESPAPNERYVQQLIAAATAAVEKVVTMGVADSKRIGVGAGPAGGSAAADLLLHTDLFRAGITAARAESDTAGQMVLFKPADGVRRPLLTLLPSHSRESVAARLEEMTSWMDKYVKGSPAGVKR